MLEGMTVSIDVDGLLNTDGRRLFGTVTAVQHDDSEPRGLMLLVQDVQPNWDASPKGGTTVVTDAMVNAALRVQYARAGSVWTGTEANPDFVDMRHILNAALQATSAEVGHG